MNGRDNRALEMLATALQMEERGKAFYEKAITTCQNELGREIFPMLMDDELVHMDRIRQIYGSLSGGEAWSEDWKALRVKHEDLGQFFRDIASRRGSRIRAETSDLEAVDIGIDFELLSIKFYEEQLTKGTDPLERGFIERMIAEERSHYTTLSDLKFYLSDPAAWFMEKERPGLDGG